MIYLITHGNCFFGPDTTHTLEGVQQINDLKYAVANLQVTVAIIGTGKRFQEIYDILADEEDGGYQDWCRAPVKFSPFCGSVESTQEDGSVSLTNGKLVDRDDYIGLFNCLAVNIWRFIFDLPDGALLFAGSELLMGLGFKDQYEEGHLYEIDPATKTCKLIA